MNINVLQKLCLQTIIVILLNNDNCYICMLWKQQFHIMCKLWIYLVKTCSFSNSILWYWRKMCYQILSIVTVVSTDISLLVQSMILLHILQIYIYIYIYVYMYTSTSRLNCVNTEENPANTRFLSLSQS